MTTAQTVVAGWAISTLASLFQRFYSDAFAPLGLNDGDYGVIATLRRAGAPFQLTPSDLSRQQMMTSGGMTAAIDRLERKGLVTRAPNPADRRGSLVCLSGEGRAVIDRAMERHALIEQQLVAGLDAKEREQLRVLLRKLLQAVESTCIRPVRPAM